MQSDWSKSLEFLLCSKKFFIEQIKFMKIMLNIIYTYIYVSINK